MPLSNLFLNNLQPNVTIAVVMLLLISESCNTNGCVNNSTVVFALTAFTLNKLNTALSVSVIVNVIVSAFHYLLIQALIL